MNRHGSTLRALLCLLSVLAGAAALAQDPLPPQQVFQYSARADAERVYLSFTVLDGYYLYRSRFGFDSATEGVTLGAARFPRGETHTDEYFGEQEIYRGEFEIVIPYQRSAPRESFDLKLELQGCADFGLCYLPQDWTATVALPSASLLGFTSGTTGSVTGDLLPVDQAFSMNARFDKPNELTVAWQIAPGYYLYRGKLGFSVTGRIDLGAPNLPKGVAHSDDNFGDVEVFYDYVEAKIPFARASPDALDVALTAGFQGCKEASICYPPGEQTMALVLPATSEFPAVSPAAPTERVSEQDQWLGRIVNGSWWTLLGGFYVAGLLLSFTPCVLPMVPILSSIIAGQGAVSSQKGFLLSLSYVLGMAATYTAAGALAALAGGQVQAFFQKPWLITIFAGLFVLLALGMFGMFELQMPAAIQTRLANMANRQKGGTFLGTAIIGALTALIVTTCVAPPLIGALTFISQTGDVARGSGALFALSIGMGTPLLVVGASAGQLLPRVGPWMNTVKAGSAYDARHGHLDDGSGLVGQRDTHSLGFAGVPDGRLPRRPRAVAGEPECHAPLGEGHWVAGLLVRRVDVDRGHARRRGPAQTDTAGRAGTRRRRRPHGFDWTEARVSLHRHGRRARDGPRGSQSRATTGDARLHGGVVYLL
jgi:thiol:disulfide interchange protein DsbD